MVARRALPVPIALLAAAAPATASAAVASRAPGSLVLELQENSDAETNSVTITLSGSTYTIEDSAGMGAGANCDDNTPDPNTVTCPSSAVASISVDLGAGNDKFVSTVATPAKVMGGAGSDDLTGGPGPDELIGGSGADTLRGGGGNDVMKAETTAGDPGTAANTMDGGSGNDTMDGGAGPDVMAGGADFDHMSGGGGADQVDGGDGNDTVAGDGGNDALAGGAGDDVIDPGPGPGTGTSDDDTIGGGPGTDEVSYAARTTPVAVTIGVGQNDGVLGEHDDVGADVERVTGGSADDSLLGSVNAEQLSGGPGADLIEGGDGADTLLGGDGDDHLDGNVDGTPQTAGRALAAPIAAPAGLTGSGDDDTLDGGDGDDVLDGGQGADKAIGGNGSDTVSYAFALTPVIVTLDGQANDGQAGEGDLVSLDIENIGGWGGKDTFTGSSSPNTMVSGGGEDYIDGAGGNDSMAAGAGFDVIRSRDGLADSVDCGGSRDFAIVDKKDLVSGSCERVARGLVKRPSLGRRFVLQPLRGGEQFGLSGMHRTVPLEDRLGMPFGTTLDATQGAVRITAAGGTGHAETGDFSGGAFLVKQARRAHGLTELDLTGGASLGKCDAPRGSARALPGRTVLRRLFGNAHGRFRTRGRNSSATVRGTQWSVIDRCDGTLTTVKRGTVVVRAGHRTVTLRSGQSFLARRGNR